MIKILNDIIKIDTPDTSLIFKKNKTVSLLYYGKKLADENDFSLLDDEKKRWHPSIDDVNPHRLQIIGCFGDGDNREPSVMLVNSKGSISNRFYPVDVGIIEGGVDLNGLPVPHGGDQTLVFQFENESGDAIYRVFYTTYSDSDVISVTASITAAGVDPIFVKRLMSNQLDLWGNDCIVESYDGVWGSEMQKHTQRLVAGNLVFDSKNGSSSNKHNPFFTLKTKAGVFGFNIIYSGNFKNIVEVVPSGIIRVVSGINDYYLDVELKNGQSFEVPSSIMAFAENNEKLTEAVSSFVENHIIPKQFFEKERPICINTWESFYMNLSREKLIRLAKRSAEAGVELFVLDDGWFEGRNDDSKGLGDWIDDEEKTGGLSSLSREVKSLGMKFGIWIEPENANFDSKLVREHPEYVLAVPKIEPMQRRKTVSLDLTNGECRDYLFEKINNIISLCEPDYIKWDYNRTLIDVYSVKSCGNYFLDYIKGLYELIKRITDLHPQILFEGCSSGGNRYDLGMLCFMPQIWTSDDTDARERLRIQQNVLDAYPKSTMSAHVSAIPNHQTGKNNSLLARFAVASMGVLGYELDFCKLGENEFDEIRDQIAFYKKYRKCLQFGKYYNLNDKCPDGIRAWISVSNDYATAVLCLVKTENQINTERGRMGLKGLSDQMTYKVKYKDRTVVVCKGDMLNSFGLDLLGEFNDKANEINGLCVLVAEIVAV